MFEVKKIREDFPMLNYRDSAGNRLVYFDNSATSLKPQCVIDAESYYYTSINSNIHRGDYELSFRADQAYDSSREKVARFINADPREVAFTSGTTASLNMIAQGLTHLLEKGDVILLSLAEHASNALPWFRAARQKGAEVKMIPLEKDGRLTVEGFRSVFSDRVKIVSLAQVTNVLA